MPEGGDPSLYPLFLKLAGRTVLVVGAGTVAERKVASLLEAGARIRLVAPTATVRLQKLAGEGAIEWRPRALREDDFEGAWLAVAATDDPEAQRQAARSAEERGTFLVAVDDPDHASAYAGAVVRRPPFTVAISSSGATPALTRLIREVVEGLLPPEQWVEHARRLRAKWRAERTPIADRFPELVRTIAERPARR